MKKYVGNMKKDVENIEEYEESLDLMLDYVPVIFWFYILITRSSEDSILLRGL